MTPIEKAIDALKNAQATMKHLNHPPLIKVEEALEALRGMQGQDLEALKRELVSALLKKEVKHVKAHAMQRNFSFNKAQGELEYFVRLVIDHLAAQGIIPFAAPPENGYNPATHILIAKEDVPEGLRDALSKTGNGLSNYKIEKAAALIAEKMPE